MASKRSGEEGLEEEAGRAAKVVRAPSKSGQELHAPSVIAHKRDGGAWTPAEVEDIVQAIVTEEMSREQIGALLMAVYLKGMTREETVALTTAFVHSGEQLRWPQAYAGAVVDKHSTGGVGDKVSLPLAPALAACGMKVPMISGRGLGHTGGTLDKLEAIPGFTVEHSTAFMRQVLDEVGCCIVGQTSTLVPADKIVYAIRDVTSTVGSVPLITASIVSKKVAEGLATLILDVKVGRAAFMQTEEDARALARSMVDAANGAGVKTLAILTQMDHPIGNMVGNGLEVIESIQCLQGKGPGDLVELVCAEGGHLLAANGVVPTAEEGIARIHQVLHNGDALAKFQAMAVAQGVDPKVAQSLCDDPTSVIEAAPQTTTFATTGSGYVEDINALAIARFCASLGAGRKVATDKVDFAVGLELLVQVGDKVDEGQDWVRVHHRGPLSPNTATVLRPMITLTPDVATLPSRVIDVIH